MLSMTGYAYIEEIIDNYQISIEIQSLNSRFLDIYIDCPSYFLSYDQIIKQQVSDHAKRGKIKLVIKIIDLNPSINISLNLPLTKAYFNVYQQIIDELKLQDNIQLNHFINTESILNIQSDRDLEKIWNLIQPYLDKALNTLSAQKKLEGTSTLHNIEELYNNIQNDFKQVKELIPQSIEPYIDKIKSKLKDLLNNTYDEQRVLMEAGILASKMDVNEEIERLNHHLNQFDHIIHTEDQVGRKLEFLTQEILREMNTIGNKINQHVVSTHIINMKNTLEQIKEQIRNIE